MSEKIEALAEALSREDIRPAAAPKVTLGAGLIVAFACALALSLVVLGARPDLVAALMGYEYIVHIKLVFALGVVAVALPIVLDLSLPGRSSSGKMLIAAIPFGAIAIVAALEVSLLPIRDWLQPVEHASWFECLWKIPALAIPAFAVLALAVRRLAPTNLVRTGAYIGLLSGGIGTLGYALHCHDDSLTFVALAYSLAVLIMVIFGAAVGPRVLRWH